MYFSAAVRTLDAPGPHGEAELATGRHTEGAHTLLHGHHHPGDNYHAESVIGVQLKLSIGAVHGTLCIPVVGNPAELVDANNADNVGGTETAVQCVSSYEVLGGVVSPGTLHLSDGTPEHGPGEVLDLVHDAGGLHFVINSQTATEDVGPADLCSDLVDVSLSSQAGGVRLRGQGVSQVLLLRRRQCGALSVWKSPTQKYLNSYDAFPE